MALPNIMRRLFRNDGYGPLLKPEIIPFTSDLDSNAADAAASTKWVKDLLVARVFLAPSNSGGSDSNDGLSSETPVATFTKAVDIAHSLHTCNVVFKVAGGSYTGDFIADNIVLTLILDGNVTITGSFTILNSSSITINNTSYTLTILDGLYIFNRSYFLCYANTAVERSSSGNNGVDITHGSFAKFGKSFTITMHTDGHGVTVERQSMLDLLAGMTVSNVSGTGSGVYVSSGSVFIDDYTDSYLSVLNHTSTNVALVITAHAAGAVHNLTVKATNGAASVLCADHSVVFITTADIAISGGTPYSLINGSFVSEIYLGGNIKLVGGSTSGTITVHHGSVANINCSFTGSNVTAGRRYLVNDGSTIVSNGGGANLIPGQSAGSIGTTYTFKDTGNTNRTIAAQYNIYA